VAKVGCATMIDFLERDEIRKAITYMPTGNKMTSYVEASEPCLQFNRFGKCNSDTYCRYAVRSSPSVTAAMCTHELDTFLAETRIYAADVSDINIANKTVRMVALRYGRLPFLRLCDTCSHSD
jgi:hypothetical protein